MQFKPVSLLFGLAALALVLQMASADTHSRISGRPAASSQKPGTHLAIAADTPSPAKIREAVNRSIPLFQKTLAEYPRHNSCFSCHHQGVPPFALTLARSRGYAVDEKTLDSIARHTTADLRTGLDSYRKGQGQPGGVTRAGYALFALQATGVKRDEITAAVSGFLLQRDKQQGFWSAGSNRPPSEASEFTNTFLAIRALNTYGETSDKDATALRIAQARQWLEQAAPKDTEDRVFRLWGMKEAGSEAATLEKAAKDLLEEQREDGGWAQLPGANSDAYATGSVLTALLIAGGIAPDDAAYRRGISYLLQSQMPDGSWHVISRSKPVQPYFESGFPYGRDQFISALATGWATAALVLASPPPGVH